ncbi:molecular chaperone [Tropicimonas sp. IMCC6043]|uniref:TorD/DmsD family molecular chaperone n=1 Tax=Tropicimonas sp. IMCC6043 TaxID=2510645 RepID=UPI00101C5AA3|nr:molecular chaperone TorD family protein [Tropicimonas sp. IMCC6043]RYH07086.1 hypothetical protein EU800_21540 [Tropicimonas sp. IMCC6043]
MDTLRTLPEAAEDIRPSLYLWLSRVMKSEQTPDTLAGYQSEEGREVMLELAAVPELSEGITEMIAVADGWTDLDRTARDLAVVYARLFLGAGDRSQQVPVYESAFTSEKGLICQQATVEIERLLRDHGLNTDGWREPADHIAVELEFLAWLAGKAGETKDPGAEAGQRELLSRHLLLWGPDFCALCIKRDTSGFYAAAARVLHDALGSEKRRLIRPK